MFRVHVRTLTLQPSVRRKGKQLRATSSWLSQMFTLGAHTRTVHVDGEAGYLYLRERSFWLLEKSRVVRFGEIAHVRYQFGDLPTGLDRTGRVHSTLEWFTVALELKTGESVALASFVGPGAAGDLVSWLYGDDLVDLEGTQEPDARSFVAQLCELTGVGLAQPFRPLPDASGSPWTCSACQRSVPPKPTCLYCGGAAGPMTR